MKKLVRVITILTLGFMLFACAPTAYQSGRVDQRLEGNGTVTKQDLKEMKKLEDQRKQNQTMIDVLGGIVDVILLFKVY